MSEGVAIRAINVLPNITHHNQSGFIKYLYSGETALSIILQLKKMRSLVAQVKLRVTNPVLKVFFLFLFLFLFFSFTLPSAVRAISRHINFPVGDIFHSRSKEL